MYVSIYDSCVLLAVQVLAACEEPANIALTHLSLPTDRWRCFENGDGKLSFPLLQTSQMRLEREILQSKQHDVMAPGQTGFFHWSTSVRDEADPIPGRHNKAFPLIEAEGMGTIHDLYQHVSDLYGHFNFPADPVLLSYKDACAHLKVNDIGAAEELELWKKFGSLIFLHSFPVHETFFNMEDNPNGTVRKMDVIACGAETNGCGERSTNPTRMYEKFFQQSGGEYAKRLFGIAGRKRVMQELDDYLALPMIPRWGYGMGGTRFIRALMLEKVL